MPMPVAAKMRLVWGMLAVLGAVPPAAAHPFSLSSFDAHTDGRDLRVDLVLDATSVRDMVARARPGPAPASIAALAGEERLILDYFAASFRVHNTDLPCALVPPDGLRVDEPAGKVRFTARFRCPTELGRLRLDVRLFAEEDTPHDVIGNFHHARAFERYFFGKGARVVNIDVPALRQSLPAEIDRAGPVRLAEPPPGAFDERARVAVQGIPVARPWASFFVRGLTHVAAGLDHVLFLVLLVAAAPAVRPALLAVAAFTLGHALTLGFGAEGLVSMSPRLAEPLIALSIVYVAIANLRAAVPRAHPGAAFGFGLVHGLGFVTGLGHVAFAPRELAAIVTAFNLGAFVGQLLVAAPVLGLMIWLGRRAPVRARVLPAVNLAVGAVGLVWFIQRLASAWSAA